MQMKTKTITPDEMEARCHCGTVRFRVKLLDGFNTIRRCTCSYCRMRGAVAVSAKVGDISFHAGEDALTVYRFNTGTAQHTFCATCGIHPFYVPRSDPDKIDVNVRCLDGVDIAALDVKQFDGRNWEHAMSGRVPWR